MKSWEKRLRELEEKRARANGWASNKQASKARQELAFTKGVLRKVVNVRRRAIDDPVMRYTPDRLFDMDSEDVAHYLAALSVQGLYDEEKLAREILQAREETTLINRADRCAAWLRRKQRVS